MTNERTEAFEKELLAAHDRFIYSDDDNSYEDFIRDFLMPVIEMWCFVKPTVENVPVDWNTCYGGGVGALEVVQFHNTGHVSVVSHDGIVKPAWKLKPQPVMLPDNTPLYTGDTVYSIETGEKFKVKTIFDEEEVFVVYYTKSGEKKTAIFRADELTHKEPDTVEGIIKQVRDTGGDCCKYYNAGRTGCSACPMSEAIEDSSDCYELMILDIARRFEEVTKGKDV